MPHRRSTFSKFIIENERRRANPDPNLTGLLNDIQTSCKFIASAVSRGALIARDDTASVNAQDAKNRTRAARRGEATRSVAGPVPAGRASRPQPGGFDHSVVGR